MRRMIDAHVHIRPKGLAGCYNQEFHVAYHKYGALTIGGVMTIQGMPEFCVDSEFTADTLVHEMDCFGIEKSIIMLSASSDVRSSKEAIQKYPDRLIAAMCPPYIEEIDKYILQKYDEGFRVIKIETSSLLGYTHPARYPKFKFNSAIMKKALQICAEKSIPFVVDPGKQFSSGYQVEELAEVIQEFPSVHFIICHLGVPFFPYVEGSRDDIRWKEMLDLGHFSNVWFDISAIPNLFKEEEYPYPSGIRLVRKFIDKYGADKILWGTDIPTTFVNCTFRQMINLFEKNPVFSDKEKRLMFYENAKKAYVL